MGRKDQPAVKKQITKTLNVTTNPEEKRKIIGDTFIKVEEFSTFFGSLELTLALHLVNLEETLMIGTLNCIHVSNFLMMHNTLIILQIANEVVSELNLTEHNTFLAQGKITFILFANIL